MTTGARFAWPRGTRRRTVIPTIGSRTPGCPGGDEGPLLIRRHREGPMRQLIALGLVATLSIALGPAGLQAQEKKPEGKAPDAAADKAKDGPGQDARG